MSRRQMMLTGVTALALLAAIIMLAGCGSGSSGLSEDKYNQLQKGMTLDEVEGIAGTPERTHKPSATGDLNIFWYYSKTEDDGLVRVSFLDGKVDSLSPYNQNIKLDE